MQQAIKMITQKKYKERISQSFQKKQIQFFAEDDKL